MVLNKIRYKNKIDFDYFEIWFGDMHGVFDHELIEDVDSIDKRATCVSTQICPWCVKKYGLYSEVERTPESIDEEIDSYKEEGCNPEELDFVCGVDGCENGAADYADINWDEGFEIIDME